MLDGRPLSADEVRKLADLESREVLLAKLAGDMKASLQQAVSLFAAPLSQAARVLGALEAQKLSEPQPPAEAREASVQEAAPEPEMPTDGTPGIEETPDTTAAETAGDEGGAAQVVADATDVPAHTDVAGDATSAS